MNGQDANSFAQFFKNRVYLQKIFSKFDTDHSGKVNLKEWINATAFLNKFLPSPLSEDKVMNLFEILDKNGDKEISIEEWLAGFKRVGESGA